MKLLLFILIYIFPLCCFAQNDINIADMRINSDYLNSGSFEWAWYQDAIGGVGNEIGKDNISLKKVNQKLIFVKHRISTKLNVDETDSLVLDAKSLTPIYKSYKGEEVTYYIHYGTGLKGVRTIYETQKKETLNEPFDGKYFDLESLPLIISSMPLNSSYRASIPIVSFTSDFKPVYYRYKITEVNEMQTVSERSGKQSVWQVRVNENKRGHEYLIYINKQTRRIVRVDFTIPSSLLNYTFFDKELDVNPIKSTFNKDQVLSMLTAGNSKITGQVYSKGYGKKFKDVRDNKKQYAEKGSTVLLIPNTPYFKEWADYNIKLSKLTGPIYTVQWDGYFGQQAEKDKSTIGTFFPLPEDVAKCILVTTVNDDKGHFSFENLKPGEYLIFVTYAVDKYSHSTSEYKGQYTAVYGDGSIESYPIWDVKDWTTPGNVKAHKYVVIENDAETVNVIFKD